MMHSGHVRIYDPESSAVFLKTHERFGGLSNMAGGYPVEVNGVRIRTSEALYQACRFPHLTNVQQLIISEASPMTAKMRAKPFVAQSRPDWEKVKVPIMKWALRVKLAQNFQKFSQELLSTGDRPIVELKVRRTDFWGAKRLDNGLLEGMNVLGRLLMELRQFIIDRSESDLSVVEPLNIPDFDLFARRIGTVRALEPISSSRLL